MARSIRVPASGTQIIEQTVENIYPDLENGLYLIHAKLSDPERAQNLPAGFRLVVFSYDHLTTRSPEEARAREYLVIRDKPDVSFVLATAPDISNTNDRYEFALQIVLTEDSARQLQEFTAKNIMRHVALVAGGKVVTTHKIRSEIIGGKLQITRCNDNGCQYIYKSLIP
ncbi:MAG: hypothetical protein KKB51_24175 [Candidatus Riflebacteria bacterium]|nr:hypothetical protein [Candidatus Riflebacteria bacterium]